MFAFYDFETSGTSPKFDQALQFAAILTDDNFDPVETVDIRCRLSDHILPSPIALAVTGVDPDLLLNQNRTLYEFSRELAALVDNWAPAIWTGYNSLQFDENVFRHLFYQNLDPVIYRTQFNDNNRLDVMRMVYACWAFGSNALQMPIGANGKITSKLDQLAPLNGFTDHDAHDALGDVRATIFVAKLIRERAPDIWAQILANMDREALRQRLESGNIFHLVERFGARPPSIYTGIYCGTNTSNDKRIGFFDLGSGKASNFQDTDEEQVAKAVEKSPKIIRSVDIGSMPLLFPAIDATAEHKADATSLSSNLDLHELVGSALAARFADRKVPELVEEKIYEGFYSADDKSLLNQFHHADWSDRPGILAQISDARLTELGNRLLALYAPDVITEAERDDFWEMVSRRWSGEIFYGESERNPGNTYVSVADDLAELEDGDRFEISIDALEEMRLFFDKRRL